jgi:hypothetical protein
LECRLVNPWPESRVRLSSDQAVPIILSGNILTFPTRPREVILIRPQ